MTDTRLDTCERCGARVKHSLACLAAQVLERVLKPGPENLYQDQEITRLRQDLALAHADLMAWRQAARIDQREIDTEFSRITVDNEIEPEPEPVPAPPVPEPEPAPVATEWDTDDTAATAEELGAELDTGTPVEVVTAPPPAEPVRTPEDSIQSFRRFLRENTTPGSDADRVFAYELKAAFQAWAERHGFVSGLRERDMAIALEFGNGRKGKPIAPDGVQRTAYYGLILANQDQPAAPERKHGRLADSDKYADTLAAVSLWAEENLADGEPTDYIRSAEIRARYNEWAADYDPDVVVNEHRVFGMLFSRACPQYKVGGVDERSADGKKVRTSTRTGVTWREHAPEEEAEPEEDGQVNEAELRQLIEEAKPTARRPAVAEREPYTGDRPGRELPKDIRTLVSLCIDQGFVYKKSSASGKGKPRLLHPSGKGMYTLPNTPSDWRSLANLRAELRKMGATV